jgi:restriction endonuclease
MKILFDATQPFQLEAIEAVVDVFAGQRRSSGTFERPATELDGELITESAAGNRLDLTEAQLTGNTRAVQERSFRDHSEAVRREVVDAPWAGMHCSIEMETGTGKTYVYLRTLLELHARYGWRKFVVVVPSVAIREGVMTSVELMRDHFRELYDNVPLEAWICDSAQVSRLRQFATSPGLQLLVINIQAFDKSTNILNNPHDKLGGRRPIEFLQAAKPVVVLDEPQNLESERARAAITSLSPLCTLRYSATHRHSLREMGTERERRQTLGRGLRLPVRADATRCHDTRLNRLTLIASEAFEDFARNLQAEFAEAGVRFTEGMVASARRRKKLHLRKGWDADPEYLALWERIQRRTRYAVRYDSQTLIERASAAIRHRPESITPGRVTVVSAAVHVTRAGLVDEVQAAFSADEIRGPATLPDFLAELQRRTELTRPTLARILTACGRLDEALPNPQQFLQIAEAEIQRVRRDLLADGVQYHPINDSVWEMALFDEELDAYLNRVQTVDKGLYDGVECDSEVEREFARQLDARTDIKLFLKLPRWFTIDTPLGRYNPDWAIVKEGPGEPPRLYLVRETKGVVRLDDLDWEERQKIACGKRHFAALGFQPGDYDWTDSATRV